VAYKIVFSEGCLKQSDLGVPETKGVYLAREVKNVVPVRQPAAESSCGKECGVGWGEAAKRWRKRETELARLLKARGASESVNCRRNDAGDQLRLREIRRHEEPISVHGLCNSGKRARQ
jgi:hypothetical protein